MPTPRSMVLLACLALGLCVAARLLTGPTLFAADGTLLGYVLEIRAQRALVAAAVGGALAVSGVLLQTLVRNDLASPDLVGASSGASLSLIAAAFVARAVGVPPAVEQFLGSRLLIASIGAVAALVLVATLASGGRSWSGTRGSGRPRFIERLMPGSLDTGALVLAGVMVSIIASAAVTLVDHLMQAAGQPRAADLGGLLLGSVRDDVGWTSAAGAALLVIIVAWVWAANGRKLDAMLLDDEQARSIGLAVGRIRGLLFLSCGLLAALAVVLAGPIAFIGLLAPHSARLLLARAGVASGLRPALGAMHGPLVVLAGLLGASLLVLADVAARLVDLGSGRLPTGVLTSLVGGVFFLGLLRRRIAPAIANASPRPTNS